MGRDGDPEVQVVASNRDEEYVPLRGAAAAATATPTAAGSSSEAGPSSPPSQATQNLRRSKRERKKVQPFVPMADDPDSGITPRRRRSERKQSSEDFDEDEENHLDQISLEEGGKLKMRVHPCAVAMMQLHVHLSKTEVIGYMGGFVLGEGIIDVAEAFPAVCVQPKEMTRSGRSAYREVEMQPESDVELRSRIESKGLTVVGWYHSHPDRKFTVEPSRVDIENQHNYQNLLFKNTPFVATILAPYNEDLPDAMGAMDCFYVADDEDTPLRVPYEIVYPSRPQTSQFAAYRAHLADRLLPDVDLQAQGFDLIMKGAEFRQRMHLLSEWRNGRRYVDKLQDCLSKLLPTPPEEGQASGNTENDSRNNEMRAFNVRLNELFAEFINLINEAWPESPQKKAAASKKRKRKGKHS